MAVRHLLRTLLLVPALLASVAAQADVVQLPGTTPQHAIVTHAFAVPLAVRVTDAQGAPMVGTQVLFSTDTHYAGFGATRADTVSTVTDSNGLATASALFATAPGSFRAWATVPALFLTQAMFDLTADPQSIASFRAATPVVQSGQGGTGADMALYALDADGAPVIRGRMEASAMSDTDPSLSFQCGFIPGGNNTIVADANGEAFLSTAFPHDGKCTVSVTPEGQAAPRLDFTLVGWDPNPILLGETYDVRSVYVNEPFTIPITVGLRTQATPVPFLALAFSTTSASGASATFSPASATTDIAGRARIDATANSRTGDYQLKLHYDAGDIFLQMRNVRRTQVPLPGPRGGTALGLAIESPTGACGFASWASIDERSGVWAQAPRAISTLRFADGLIDASLADCPAGQPLRLRITYPVPVAAGSAFWVYGPDGSGIFDWHSLPIEASGNDAIVTITDGGAGDTDLLVNGALHVIGGVATKSPAAGGHQDMWWAGLAENGWGVSIVQHDDKLFCVIYVYDAAGAPTWYVMPAGTWNARNTAFTGDLYSPRGSPFYAYDASRFAVGAAIGSATFGFSDADHATLTYVVNGVAGTKSITRQLFGPAATAPLSGLGDMWWGGMSQNGWGIAVLQQYATLFSVWFTYDGNGSPTWYVMPSGRWADAQTWAGHVYRTTGSPWLAGSYDPSRLQVIDVGSFILHFDGGNATFNYTVDGHTGTLPLTRQLF